MDGSRRNDSADRVHNEPEHQGDQEAEHRSDHEAARVSELTALAETCSVGGNGSSRRCAETTTADPWFQTMSARCICSCIAAKRPASMRNTYAFGNTRPPGARCSPATAEHARIAMPRPDCRAPPTPGGPQSSTQARQTSARPAPRSQPPACSCTPGKHRSQPANADSKHWRPRLPGKHPRAADLESRERT